MNFGPTVSLVKTSKLGALLSNIKGRRWLTADASDVRFRLVEQSSAWICSSMSYFVGPPFEGAIGCSNFVHSPDFPVRSATGEKPGCVEAASKKVGSTPGMNPFLYALRLAGRHGSKETHAASAYSAMDVWTSIALMAEPARVL